MGKGWGKCARYQGGGGVARLEPTRAGVGSPGAKMDKARARRVEERGDGEKRMG